MTRTLTATIETEIGKEVIRPVLFLKLLLDAADGGDLNYWSGIGTFTFNGDDYIGTGVLGSITEVKETQELTAQGVKFSLTSIPAENIAIALEKEYAERPCKLWLGFLTQAGTLLADPVLLFTGRLDVMELSEAGDTCTISISAENRLVDLERPKVRYYTDEDQKMDYPDDTGFAFVSSLNDGRTVTWGH